jgi:hypothetical protein
VTRDFKLRNKCLNRDGHVCLNCGVTANQAHHIVPLSLGGNDILSNLVSLCEECHEKVHGLKLRNHSELTKAGIQRAKEKGVVFGGWRGHPPGSMKNHLERLNRVKQEKVREEAKELAPILRDLRDQGMSQRAIADYLNSQGLRNSYGRLFHATKVGKLLKILDEFTASGPG